MRIEDILIQNNTNNGIFRTYKPLVDIANKIRPQFLNKFKIDSENELFSGFPINEGGKSGIISNIMALSTLLELENMSYVDATNITDIASLEALKFSYDDESTETKGTKKKKKNKFISLLQIIFSQIYKDGKLWFGLTPYLEKKDDIVGDYIETISKVFITFIDLRKKLIRDIAFSNEIFDKIYINDRDYNYNEFVALVEGISIECIKILNDSVLFNTRDDDNYQNFSICGVRVERNPFNSELNYRGWTYKKTNNYGLKDENTVNYGSSLYFTYHVTNSFLSFYKDFIPFFSYCFGDDVNGYRIPSTFNSLEINDFLYEKRFAYDKKFFEENIDLIISFREKVAKSGRYYYQKLLEKKVDLSNSFVDSNLNPISFFDVTNSLSVNNFATNTLFLISIFLNSGIDDDFQWYAKTTGDESAKKEFFDMIYYAVLNVRKVYNIMKLAKKDDYIRNYRITFDEIYPEADKDFLRLLRGKINFLNLYDLIPLMCNTFYSVTEYIINYPQKEMIDNLSYIVESSKTDPGEEYIWEKNGFDINNNLYYIFALENFYDYYYKYEYRYIDNEQKYEENRKIISEYEERLVAAKQEIAESFENPLRQKNEECEKNEEEKEVLKNKISELNSIINAQSIQDMIEKLIDNKIQLYVDEMINQSIYAQFDIYKKSIDESDYMILEKMSTNNKKAYQAIMLSLLCENIESGNIFNKIDTGVANKNDKEMIKEYFIGKMSETFVNRIK